ncbi:hypothetical protein Leryth_003986 [Lithospermum erythrorhizon]|nr:hypothetical protein Leryth_003986 [Lithospermum erythrorhizon]
MDEAAATEIKAMPAAIAAVFSTPSEEDPAVPELIALSAIYTAGCRKARTLKALKLSLVLEFSLFKNNLLLYTLVMLQLFIDEKVEAIVNKNIHSNLAISASNFICLGFLILWTKYEAEDVFQFGHFCILGLDIHRFVCNSVDGVVCDVPADLSSISLEALASTSKVFVKKPKRGLKIAQKIFDKKPERSLKNTQDVFDELPLRDSLVTSSKAEHSTIGVEFTTRSDGLLIHSRIYGLCLRLESSVAGFYTSGFNDGLLTTTDSETRPTPPFRRPLFVKSNMIEATEFPAILGRDSVGCRNHLTVYRNLDGEVYNGC